MHQKHFDDEMIRNDKKMYGFLSSKLTNCADERIVLKTTFIAGTWVSLCCSLQCLEVLAICGKLLLIAHERTSLRQNLIWSSGITGAQLGIFSNLMLFSFSDYLRVKDASMATTSCTMVVAKHQRKTKTKNPKDKMSSKTSRNTAKIQWLQPGTCVVIASVDHSCRKWRG